jgi:copper chaperone CopZ
MKYSVDIQGMHCNGCARLVAMGLAEEDLKEIKVDLATNRATFESADKREAVQAKVDRVAADLADYKFAAVRSA